MSKYPRAFSTWEFFCRAPDNLMYPWDELIEEAKKEFSINGPIPCEGGFQTGPYCIDCRFGKGELIDETFVDQENNMISDFLEPDDRDLSLWVFHCKIPVEQTKEWTKPFFAWELPCDGGFVTGPWCINCHYGKGDKVDEE